MNIFQKIIYGGDSKPDEFEGSIFEPVGLLLQDSSRKKLKKQMELCNCIQRFDENRMRQFHFVGKKSKLEIEQHLFHDLRENLLLARISFDQERETALFLHQGKISSLESNFSVNQNDVCNLSPEVTFVDNIFLGQ